MNPKKPALLGIENRREKRLVDLGFQFPISFYLRSVDRQLRVPLETINYHHRGACFRFGECQALSLEQLKSNNYSIEIFLGQTLIKENLGFKICWETFAQDGAFGVEFKETVRSITQRAERFRVHENLSPTLSVADPTDPNRELYFKILDISRTGLSLETSLTNRHLLPGMILSQGKVSIPGQKIQSTITLKLSNTRPRPQENTFELGAAIVGASAGFLEEIRTYLSLFGSSQKGESNRLEKLSSEGLLEKDLKHGITFRVIHSLEDYESLLRLRFEGYGYHGKLKSGTSWQDQGEGLQSEGVLICGFLAGQMISSMELRFSDHGPLPRIANLLHSDLSTFGIDKFVEINKLVVHPKAQGTNTVLGMIQRAHAILLERGAYDVVISATDKLAPLYERVGFKNLGVKIPHPYLNGIALNLMLANKAVYLEAEGINPHAWSVAFESTQRHLEAHGIAKPIQLGVRKSLTKAFTRIFIGTTALVRKRNRNRHRSPQDANQPVEKATNQKKIDPAWTVQHFATEVIFPYILESEDIIGKDKTRVILDELKVPREYIMTQGNWVSVPFLDAFLDKYAVFGNIADLSSRAGQRAFRPDVMGLKYYALKHLLRPENAFRTTENILPKINLTRTYKFEVCRPGFVKVSLRPKSKELLPKHSESCINWQASFAEHVRIMTGDKGSVQKTSCAYLGADSCTYEVMWPPNRGKSTKAMAGIAVSLTAASIVYLYAPTLFKQGNLASFFIVIQGAALGVMTYSHLRVKREKKEIDSKFQDFQTASDQRYSSLQETTEELSRRYRELTLIAETTSAIQKNSELSSILSATLTSVCEKFGFARGFVMLANEDKTTLRTAAIGGVSKSVDKIWKFGVDISLKRENPLVLSSVFHTGRTVLINNAKTHLPNLNPASQELIRSLEAESFIISAIPAEHGNWGVLVVDKGQSPAPLTEADSSVLERVAHSLGLALDKQSKLESERRDRALFEKFVPAFARKDLVSLGWESRETIAMFVDIRSYTELSETLAPTGIARMVNAFYELVHTTAREHMGYTDKYIGDAALVTWGYLDALPERSDIAVECAFAIHKKLRNLNLKLQADGIPPLRIGIGLHRGPAVCGLFGCNDRMDFTGIGGTLNAASRLQALCKEYKSTITVSESILDSLSSEVIKEVVVVDEVLLRGIKNRMKVGYWRLT